MLEKFAAEVTKTIDKLRQTEEDILNEYIKWEEKLRIESRVLKL